MAELLSDVRIRGSQTVSIAQSAAQQTTFVTMDSLADLDDLHRRSQENLVQFLHIELDIARTFCKLAADTARPERREHLLQNIQKAIDTVHYFKDRIEDPQERREIDRQVDRLGKLKTGAGE